MKRLQKRNPSQKPQLPQWLRFLLFAAGSLCMGAAIAFGVLWIDLDILSLVRDWIVEHPAYTCLTVLLYAALVYCLGAILGRLWLAGWLTGLAALILALVDYFKTAINGTPLSVADFGMAAQLGNVAGVAGDLTPPVDFWRALSVVTFCAGLLLLLGRWFRLNGQSRFLGIGLGAAMVSALFTPSCALSIAKQFEVDLYAYLSTANNNATHGLTVALWRDLMMQEKSGPQEYSQQYMEAVLERIDVLLSRDAAQQETTAEAAAPNVIVILAESFFDLTRLPDLTYERDPLENFHALQEEAISGDFFSQYLGYGTGYIEMSLQYGISNFDFNPTTNICFLDDEKYELFDSLVEQFTNTGDYRAEMLHAYDNSLYNRVVTYPMLGYSDTLFELDMLDMDIGWEGSIYGGYFMQDAYLYECLLQRMEDINKTGKRAYLYGVTMENHQPFNADKFNYECQIGVESELLPEEDLAIARVMLEGMTRSDQALGRLTDALRESDEPTVVVFYGDHRPNLFMTDGDTIYTRYGLCPSNDTEKWTAEEIADLYSTDYLIWANDAALSAYDGLLEGGTTQDSSVSALGPQLLELLGVETSRYWRLLQEISRIALVNEDLYFVNGESKPFTSAEEAGLTPEQEELLYLRETVIYDAFFGQQYITAAMNQPVNSH